jgi:hypothetical protein
MLNPLVNKQLRLEGIHCKKSQYYQRFVVAFVVLFFISVPLWAQFPTSNVDREKEQQRFCKTCDSVTATAQQPVIYFIDIRNNYSSSEQRFNAQRTKPFLLEVAGREYAELKKQWGDKCNVELLFNNKLLKIPNKQQQQYDFRDQLKDYHGLVYWSGNPADKAIRIDDRTMLTEQLSAQLKMDKSSSYVISFMEDAMAVARYKKAFSPSDSIRKNIQALLYDQIHVEMELMNPAIFLDLTKVKTFTGTLEQYRYKFSFEYNAKGQLVKFYEMSKGEKMHETVIAYVQGMPAKMTEGPNITTFNYAGDTVIVTTEHDMDLYLRNKRLFISAGGYAISDQYEVNRYTDKMLNGTSSRIEDNCVVTNYRYNQEKIGETCYTNYDYQLPFERTYIGVNEEIPSVYAIKRVNADQVDVTYYRSTTRHYFRQGKLVNLVFNEKESDPQVSINVAFTYYP